MLVPSGTAELKGAVVVRYRSTKRYEVEPSLDMDGISGFRFFGSSLSLPTALKHGQTNLANSFGNHIQRLEKIIEVNYKGFGCRSIDSFRI